MKLYVLTVSCPLVLPGAGPDSVLYLFRDINLASPPPTVSFKVPRLKHEAGAVERPKVVVALVSSVIGLDAVVSFYPTFTPGGSTITTTAPSSSSAPPAAREARAKAAPRQAPPTSLSRIERSPASAPASPPPAPARRQALAPLQPQPQPQPPRRQQAAPSRAAARTPPAQQPPPPPRAYVPCPPAYTVPDALALSARSPPPAPSPPRPSSYLPLASSRPLPSASSSSSSRAGGGGGGRKANPFEDFSYSSDEADELLYTDPLAPLKRKPPKPKRQAPRESPTPTASQGGGDPTELIMLRQYVPLAWNIVGSSATPHSALPSCGEQEGQGGAVGARVRGPHQQGAHATRAAPAGPLAGAHGRQQDLRQASGWVGLGMQCCHAGLGAREYACLHPSGCPRGMASGWVPD
jgi:hypothetical protein